MKVRAVALILIVLLPFTGAFAQTKPENAATEPVEKLAGDFWGWRAQASRFASDKRQKLRLNR
jgi:hypothetical protein